MSIGSEELATLDFSDVATSRPLQPVSPGDILLHYFMEPFGLSASSVAYRA